MKLKILAQATLIVFCLGCRPPAPPPTVLKSAPAQAEQPALSTPVSDAEKNTPAKHENSPTSESVKETSPTADESKAANEQPATDQTVASEKQEPESNQLATATDASVLKEGTQSNPSATDPTAQPTADVSEPHERMLLLAAGGPIIIDAYLKFEGQQFEDALDRLADDAFRTADEDGDGKTTWEDLAENPRFRSGEFGNLVANTDEERQQLISIYDADKDGLVDREELPRFITRNAGGGKSFSLRSSNEFRGTNRRRSPTRLLIDENRDGAMSSGELEAAPAKLLSRDANNDDIVVLAEVKDSVTEMMAQPAMMSGRRRVDEPDTAVWLTDKSIDMSRRWGMVQFQLQELYSFGEAISESDWPLTPDLFHTLDADGNGELAKSELAKLLEVPAHLVLDLSFDGKDESLASPTLKLRQLSSEMMALNPKVRELPTRVSLQLPSTEIELFVNQDSALTNVVQAIKPQFMAFDRNQNGYWEKDEVPERIPLIDVPFETLDADGDEKVYEQELVTYVQRRSSVTRAQVRARAADQEDALFTALDSDGDGRLNGREIRLATAQLKSFDQNQDDKILSDEIPGSMLIGFVRGNPQQDDQLLAATAAMSGPVDATLPRWFRGMDANVDGELSVHEFFGNQDKFRRLDSDTDGYISIAEAKAFDAVEEK